MKKEMDGVSLRHFNKTDKNGNPFNKYLLVAIVKQKRVYDGEVVENTSTKDYFIDFGKVAGADKVIAGRAFTFEADTETDDSAGLLIFGIRVISGKLSHAPVK